MIACIDAGIVTYDTGLEWQRELAKKRRSPYFPDHLLLLEHPPVYTMGRRDSASDLLVDERWIRRHGMKLYKTDRGGRITYHGPGQLVGYLIFKLRDSIPKFVWKIEEALLRTLDHFQLEGSRDKAHPGIWVEDRKIAALGLRVEKGVTQHGFALNVTCDLKPFQYILPCGITDRGVTSLEMEIGWTPSMRDVKQCILTEFSRIFQTKITMAADIPTVPE